MMQLYSVGIKHNNHLAFKYEVKKEIISTYILLHEVFSYEWMWSMYTVYDLLLDIRMNFSQHAKDEHSF